jgi:hypothetical protein
MGSMGLIISIPSWFLIINFRKLWKKILRIILSCKLGSFLGLKVDFMLGIWVRFMIWI